MINIVSGCDDQTQAVIDAGLLPYLHRLLISPPNETVCKEACLIVSNITAGNIGQVQSVIDQQMVPTLVEILKFADYRTKREACWAIGNAVLNRDLNQVDYLVSQGVISQLMQLLDTQERHDDRVIIKTLETLRNILIVGDQIAINNNVNPSSDFEMKLLDQFQSMQIQNEANKPEPCHRLVDSAYHSSSNLFQSSDNPYKSYLLDALSPLQNPVGQTGVDRLRQFANGSTPPDFKNAYRPSREVGELAHEILATWFA